MGWNHQLVVGVLLSLVAYRIVVSWKKIATKNHRKPQDPRCAGPWHFTAVVQRKTRFSNLFQFCQKYFCENGELYWKGGFSDFPCIGCMHSFTFISYIFLCICSFVHSFSQSMILTNPAGHPSRGKSTIPNPFVNPSILNRLCWSCRCHFLDFRTPSRVPEVPEDHPQFLSVCEFFYPHLKAVYQGHLKAGDGKPILRRLGKTMLITPRNFSDWQWDGGLPPFLIGDTSTQMLVVFFHCAV